MKTSRQIAKNKFFVTIMSFVLLFATTYTSEAATIDLGIDKDVSAEQMFREIFFFQGGNMTKTLPKAVQEEYQSLSRLTPEQSKERNAVIENIVQLVKKNNPSYLSSLKSAVMSKNPYLLRDALTNGGNLIMNGLNLTQQFKQLESSLGDRDIDLSNKAEVDKLVNELKAESNIEVSKEAKRAEIAACIAIGFALVLLVAIAGVAVLISVIVEVINYGITDNFERSNLKGEQFINSVFTAYAG